MVDPELDVAIARFNTRQWMVHRTIRKEIGAGASNFVRFCALHLPDGLSALFVDVPLGDDGLWDGPSLRSSLVRAGVGSAPSALERAIDKKVEMIAVHLGSAQGEALRRNLDELARTPG